MKSAQANLIGHFAKLLLKILFILQFSSCAANNHWNASRMREHGITFYSNQIIDNLIRGSEGELFLHVEISQQDSTSTAGVSSQVAGSNIKRWNPLSFFITPSAGGDAKTTINPLVRDPEVYKPYLQFLNLESPNERLAECNFDCRLQTVLSVQKRPYGDPLPPHIRGTMRRRNGFTYFIPIEYKQAYFDLCMAVIGKIEGASDATGPRFIQPTRSSTALQLDYILNQVRSLQ